MKPQQINLFTTVLLSQEHLTFTGVIDSFVQIKEEAPPQEQEQKLTGDPHALYIIELCRAAKGDDLLITSICERYVAGKHNEKTRQNIYQVICNRPAKRSELGYSKICDLIKNF